MKILREEMKLRFERKINGIWHPIEADCTRIKILTPYIQSPNGGQVDKTVKLIYRWENRRVTQGNWEGWDLRYLLYKMPDARLSGSFYEAKSSEEIY